jgi:hypothetical protein
LFLFQKSALCLIFKDHIYALRAHKPISPSYLLLDKVHFCERKGSAFREAHSSGTTEARNEMKREGDGATAKQPRRA